jgi:Guanylate kinase.
MYETKHSTEFDKAELSLYEEVTKMPPLKRKTIALVGCQGVGRRTLKARLINSNPEKFAAVIPCKYYLLPITYLFFRMNDLIF